MPTKPKKPCKHPGCPLLTAGNYCASHIRLHVQDRPNANDRGYNTRWRTSRKLFLRFNPICSDCQQSGKLTPATVVDHIKPHRGDKVLFWDASNWQPLCKRCHDRKTRTRDQHQEYNY